MDQFVKLPEIEFIYALHTGNDDFFYAGRTNDLTRRLGEHRRSGDPNGSKKERKIYELQEAGKEIFIKPLMAGYPINLINEEESVISQLREQGHDLTNEAEGTDPRVTPSGVPPVPWSIDLFTNGEWKKTPKCKTGEKSCDIKGVEFFRKGKSALRFWSPIYGDWSVGGAHGRDVTDLYVRAIAWLTPGTKDNEFLKEQVARMKRK